MPKMNQLLTGLLFILFSFPAFMFAEEKKPSGETPEGTQILGVALPVIWDYQWTRPEEISEDQFEEDRDFYETVGKVVGTLLGGSGFEIGWSF